MKTILIRWIIVAIAIGLTAYLIPGITVDGNGVIIVLATAAILGFVNAFIRPLLAFLSCGFIILTLGLFMLVVNAVSLMIASWIATSLGLGFHVNGFWPAFWGSILISVISFVLSLFVKGDDNMS